MSNSIRNFARTLTLTVATLLGTSSMALASEPANTDAVQQSSKTLEGQVNINTASSAQLELLPGIGPAIAKRIIDYRKDHPFQQRNHIMRVKGVGSKTFARIKDFLSVEGETTLKLVK